MLESIKRWCGTRRRKAAIRRAERAANRRVRGLVVDGRAHRMARVARSQGLDIDRFTESILLMASESSMTEAQVLDQVEQHGLAGAQERIAASMGN
jgi:hypothetical protein